MKWWLVLAWVIGGLAGPAFSQTTLAQDAEAIAQASHRLAGTAEHEAVVAYLQQRLSEIGVAAVIPLDFPVVQVVDPERETTLLLGGRSIRLDAIRPNVVVPATLGRTLDLPWVYLGRGALEEYVGRSVEGAVAAMDYGCGENWERAFARGAAAVVFLGNGNETATAPKHAPVAMNLPRFYLEVNSEDTRGINFRADRPQVTLSQRSPRPSGVRAVGRNLVAVIPGTDPRGEVLVVAAATDSFGQVPVRSPGARRAANVAGLLALAEQWVKNPPRRDVWLVFHDAGAQRHRGARFFYDAAMMSGDTHDRLVRQHTQESRQVKDALHALGAGETDSLWVQKKLQSTADAMRADLNQKRQVLRRHGNLEANAAQIQTLKQRVASWDRVRRWLNEGGGHAAVPAEDRTTVAALMAALEQSLHQRAAELRAELKRDAQRTTLRDAMGHGDQPSRIVLHVDLDLSDAGAVWSAVTGGWTHRLYGLRRPGSTADAPGYHGRVLAGFDAIAQRSTPARFASLERRALRDPGFAASFVPGRHVHAGAVAGGFGVYHVALMTGHDARLRDGHPSDTLDHFDLARFSSQFLEAEAMLREVADDPAFSLSASFSPAVVSKYPGWDGRRATGSFVTRRVTGGLSENRPADEAVVALWPGRTGHADAGWSALAQSYPADYNPIDLAPVDSNGRFAIVGLRSDLDEQLMTLGVRFDTQGQLLSTTTQNTVVQDLGKAIRVDLFDGKGYGLTWWGHREASGEVKILRASSDAAYRENRSLVGRGGRQTFWFLADRSAEPGVKVFDPTGPTALGVDAAQHAAAGVELARFSQPASWTDQTSADLWRLNEGRLSRLRSRGVTTPDLEMLHAEAGRLMEKHSPAATAKSIALSQKVYPQLRQTMNDLVHAVVVLLLLTIPFSFAMERLLIGAVGVYGRIAGFTAMFLLTFGLLYATHPGFAVASTPAMIFLAFSIVLLSSMVIWGLVQRFRNELAVMQRSIPALGMPPGNAPKNALGNSAGTRSGTALENLAADSLGSRPEGSSENAPANPAERLRENPGASYSGHSGGYSGGGDAGGGGAVMAAIGMGVSTMRRRPMRTTLTAITVVMLTFTILCFASVSHEVGVRRVGLGPVTETMPRGSVLVRRLDAGALELGVLDALGEVEGLAESWWRLPSTDDPRPITVARVDDERVARLGAVMGLDQQALSAWPGLAQGFGAADSPDAIYEALERGEIFLPPDTAEALGLSPGDRVLVDGCEMVFAATTLPKTLDRLRHADGESLLPVDLSAQAALRSNTPSAPASDTDAITNTVRLHADQVAIASNRIVEQLGGELHNLTLFALGDADPEALAQALAKVLTTPVWSTGPSGTSRRTFGRVTRVSGVMSLLVPILLGGLIIFGTLLGSISDRQREIYTFSALGLGPKHVGMLFFAEAAVYAVVGGLGGQLLAQVVALAASWMAAWGWIEPVSINFASTQALFAIGVVMATVLISAIYPAIRASRSANPGLARAWVMPNPEPAPRDDELRLTFPFTVSAYDLTGVVAYLAEHFEQHADAGLGPFAASATVVGRDKQGRVRLTTELALAPFDLGVTQQLTLTGVPSDIPGVDEVEVHLHQRSGTKGDWLRANRVFIKRLRRQFLVWRTLPTSAVEAYRMRTLQTLGEPPNQPIAPIES